jgi:pimeloyl-ACP methyl ester carboxylesterase
VDVRSARTRKRCGCCRLATNFLDDSSYVPGIELSIVGSAAQIQRRTAPKIPNVLAARILTSFIGGLTMVCASQFNLLLPPFAALLLLVGLSNPVLAQQSVKVYHKTVRVGDLDIFYREAGPRNAPAILLLHGFPTSSQMFRNLIPALADEYRVIAPDYPGYGHSSMPPHDKFAYTFDNLAKVIDEFTEKLGLTKYAVYVQDYGAPVGYRLATQHPDRITAIVVQNGNAYEEGLDNKFWQPIKDYWKEPNSQTKRDAIRNLLTYDATKWQYTTGVKNPDLVSPDGAAHDQFLLDRKGNDEIQLDLFLSYGSNPPLYPQWQAYFRKYQPPMLIVWGKNDQIFPPAGAEPYKRDVKTLEFHLLDAGHFALESNGDEIARLMHEFLGKHVAKR